MSTQKELASQRIFDATLQLMETRSYRTITISQIAERAGVSRMAFYRNYSSKDDILTHHLDKMFDGYFARFTAFDSITTYDLAEGFCDVFFENKEFISALIGDETRMLILNSFLKYLDRLYKAFINEKIHHTATIYERAYNAGGLYMVLYEWALNDFADDPAMITQTLVDLSRQI